MKNSILAGLLLLGVFSVHGQQADSALTEGGRSDVYYSFLNGEVDRVSNTNWDISFEIKGFLSGIHVNEQAGARLYITPFAVSQWAAFDSTGKDNWTVSHNGNSSWSQGAFNTNSTGDFDLGWGSYDINTHAVVGDSIYLLRTRGGDWKKIYIKSLANSIYTFVYANPDGSSEVTAQIRKSDFNDVNFAYYDIAANTQLNREPNSNSWDVVFTKYLLGVPAGPVMQYYPVSGVLLNKGNEAAQRNNVIVSNNDTSTLIWNSDISEIGSDWKSWNGSAYDITPDQSFFVRTGMGQVWKIYFTDYKGGSEGNFYFVKESMSGSVSVEDPITPNRDTELYPNPASGSFKLGESMGSGIVKVRMFDQSGRTIRNWGAAPSYSLEGVQAGMYFVEIVRPGSSELRTLVVR
ncbi:MAG: T9SS type A sorting domain-containing protein [Flavobacteriales bacterium]|nr:T9SS type A sorting domain-containing protein [Flavobacteriales bacterium]